MSKKKIELFDSAEVIAHADTLFTEEEYGLAWQHRLAVSYRNGAHRQSTRDQKIVDELLGVIEMYRARRRVLINDGYASKEDLKTFAAIDAKLEQIGVK